MVSVAARQSRAEQRHRCRTKRTFNPGLALIVTDVQVRVVVGLLSNVVKAAVDEMLDSGPGRQLEESDAPIGLGLLSKSKAISVDDDVVYTASCGDKGVNIVAALGGADDELDIWKSSQ